MAIASYELDSVGPTRVVADKEGNGDFHFWAILDTFLHIFEIFQGILKELVRCVRIKNFHQLETNKENKVLRPL